MENTLFRPMTPTEELDAAISIVLLEWDKYSLEERIELVTNYTEQYFELEGMYPKSSKLQELADLLLMEELTNSHPDKVARTEYPILTGKQLVRRQKRTVLSNEESIIDFLNMKYNAATQQTQLHRRVTTGKRE